MYHGPKNEAGAKEQGKAKPPVVPRRRNLLVLLAALAGGLLLLLGAVLAFTFRHGTLTVEIDENLGKDVQVTVNQGGEQSNSPIPSA